MKVLHVINNLSSGGAEKLLKDFVIIASNDYDIKFDILILTDKNNVFDKELSDKGIKIYKSKYKSIYDPRNIVFIRKLIEKNNYDIVHSHLFPSFYWVAVASLFAKGKVKYVFTEHSTHNRRRERLYFRYLEKYIYSRFDKIVSISDMTQVKLLDWLKLNKKLLDRFVVIENGIDIRKYREAVPYNKSEINSMFDEDTKLICMVGRFTEQKDQLTVIRAVSRLPKNVHLILVGEGPLKKQYVDYVQKLSLKDRVHFLGFREDVHRILKTVDIVVLSSNWEGFGLAAVEGMAAGKPVIASNVPGLSEVVRGAGILFEKGDYIDLSEKIKKLLEDKKLYNEIQEKCSKRAEKFDIKYMIKRYVDIYFELVK